MAGNTNARKVNPPGFQPIPPTPEVGPSNTNGNSSKSNAFFNCLCCCKSSEDSTEPTTEVIVKNGRGTGIDQVKKPKISNLQTETKPIAKKSVAAVKAKDLSPKNLMKAAKDDLKKVSSQFKKDMSGMKNVVKDSVAAVKEKVKASIPKNLKKKATDDQKKVHTKAKKLVSGLKSLVQGKKK